MTTINILLNFNGNCEEAFLFYKSVIGGEFAHISRFGEMEGEAYRVPEDEQNKIMHISLPIGNSNLMGSDTIPEWVDNFKHGNNFSVAITADSKEQAFHLFSALSKDGQVSVPLNRTFLGYYFGMLVDKFGINWMINFTEATEEE